MGDYVEKKPGISIDLGFYISYKDKCVGIELFSTRYDYACQISLRLPQPNTSFGLLARPNIQTNLPWLFEQCKRERNIYVANQQRILTGCMRYLSQQVFDINVVNYIIFRNQADYSCPQYSQSYTAQFSPSYLVANVSNLQKCLDDINMHAVFNYLSNAYKKTERHLYDIQHLSHVFKSYNQA